MTIESGLFILTGVFNVWHCKNANPLLNMKRLHSIVTKKKNEIKMLSVHGPSALTVSAIKTKNKGKNEKRFSFTYCIFLVRLAAPQVADHSLQSLHSHCTVWHVHIVFLVSFSGGWVQVCGRPEQSGCCTTIWVVWMDRVLSADPHVADQSVHGFQVHLTLLQGPWRMNHKWKI